MAQQGTVYDAWAPPASNEIRIIIPFNWTDYSFDTSVYSPIMTGNRLSLQDLQGFLHRLGQAANNYKLIRWTCTSVIILLLSIFLVIGISVWIADFMLTSNAKPELVIGFGVSGIVSTGFVMGFLIIRYDHVRLAKTKKLHNQMNLVVQEANNYYAGMGLRFRLPPYHFRWIELWLDFKFAQVPINNATVQYPNVNFNNNMNYQTYQPPSLHQQPHNIQTNNNTTNTGEYNNPLYPTF